MASERSRFRVVLVVCRVACALQTGISDPGLYPGEEDGLRQHKGHSQEGGWSHERGRMKITGFYYLRYPDTLPVDPLVAESEAYVEVGSEEGSTSQFDYTYALTVCTIGFLKEHLRSHPSYASRSLIVVERFADDLIAKALRSCCQTSTRLQSRNDDRSRRRWMQSSSRSPGLEFRP